MFQLLFFLAGNIILVSKEKKLLEGQKGEVILGRHPLGLMCHKIKGFLRFIIVPMRQSSKLLKPQILKKTDFFLVVLFCFVVVFFNGMI